MQGIDISSHNTGINTATIPGDFVIVKLTQGKTYKNPDYSRAMEQAKGKKLLGCYHYINGAGYQAEMDNFISHYNQYKGNAIACLDWEAIQNSEWGNVSYLEKCIEYFKVKTGITPFIYASLSVFPHTVADKYGCPKWIAQYANYKETGYQDNPWNEGAYSCAIRQYSETGKLAGWSGKLDLDKSYITREQWFEYANGSGSTSSPISPSDDCVTSIAKDVIAGYYGNGNTRKNAIYSTVQKRVNSILKGNIVPQDCVTELAKRVIAGEFGNGNTRKEKLYRLIQDRVNELLK